MESFILEKMRRDEDSPQNIEHITHLEAMDRASRQQNAELERLSHLRIAAVDGMPGSKLELQEALESYHAGRSLILGQKAVFLADRNNTFDKPRSVVAEKHRQYHMWRAQRAARKILSLTDIVD